MQTRLIGLILLLSVVSWQCDKIRDGWPPGKGTNGHTSKYSSRVVSEWIGLQLEFLKEAPTAQGNPTFSRQYAYGGITLYEAVVGGMPNFRSLAGQLNGLNNLPNSTGGASLNWALSANAALADFTRKFYAHIPDAETRISQLENSLMQFYSVGTNNSQQQRSIEFGKAIAAKIFSWSETDGHKSANDPFTAPADKIGPGFWAAPNPPSIQSLPYLKNVRRLVAGSGDGAELPAPPPYSTDPKSPFYKMVKEVYDASPADGSEEKAMAMYWRDVPGTTTPGHYLSILKQVLEKDNVSLDKAAISYALAGIMVHDACISTWTTKYKYWLVRPITYIQTVMGHADWAPAFGTPPHPEYPSAHSSLSAANAHAMTLVFGENYKFEDHTFDYLHNPETDPLMFKPRKYSSFKAIAEEAGISRLYGGIHYRFSIEQGLKQGWKVAGNIEKRLKLQK